MGAPAESSGAPSSEEKGAKRRPVRCAVCLESPPRDPVLLPCRTPCCAPCLWRHLEAEARLANGGRNYTENDAGAVVRCLCHGAPDLPRKQCSLFSEARVVMLLRACAAACIRHAAEGVPGLPASQDEAAQEIRALQAVLAARLKAAEELKEQLSIAHRRRVEAFRTLREAKKARPDGPPRGAGKTADGRKRGSSEPNPSPLPGPKTEDGAAAGAVKCAKCRRPLESVDPGTIQDELRTSNRPSRETCAGCGHATCLLCFELAHGGAPCADGLERWLASPGRGRRFGVCPGCAAPIEKIIGCDMMQCARCNTQWSRNTWEIHSSKTRAINDNREAKARAEALKKYVAPSRAEFSWRELAGMPTDPRSKRAARKAKLQAGRISIAEALRRQIRSELLRNTVAELRRHCGRSAMFRGHSKASKKTDLVAFMLDRAHAENERTDRAPDDDDEDDDNDGAQAP